MSIGQPPPRKSGYFAARVRRPQRRHRAPEAQPAASMPRRSAQRFWARGAMHARRRRQRALSLYLMRTLLLGGFRRDGRCSPAAAAADK